MATYVVNNNLNAVTVGRGPKGLAVSPDGTRLFVANELSSTVSVIDTAANLEEATLNVEEKPRGVVIKP